MASTPTCRSSRLHALCPIPNRPTNRPHGPHQTRLTRSEEHTSEHQSLMRKSYAVFCLKKKKTKKQQNQKHCKRIKHLYLTDYTEEQKQRYTATKTTKKPCYDTSKKILYGATQDRIKYMKQDNHTEDHKNDTMHN